jgi:tetratricopeptide (TPR) repeat protein
MERLKKLRAVEQDRRMGLLKKFREGPDKKGRRELEAPLLMLDPMFNRPPDDMGVVGAPLNPRDAAHFDVARVLCKVEKFDEAIKELEKVVAGSPDKAAVSAAHFSIANLYRRHLGNADKAIEHYSKVEGDLQQRAFRAMMETFEELGEIERAGQFLEKRILLTEDKPCKVRLLNQLAQLYMRNEENEKAIDVLRRIPETITYEEAEKMEKIGPPPPPHQGPEMLGMHGDVFQFGDAPNARVIQKRIGPDGEQVIIMEGGPVIRMNPEGKREK